MLEDGLLAIEHDQVVKPAFTEGGPEKLWSANPIYERLGRAAGGRAESERGYALFIMAAAFKAADHFSNNESPRVPKVAMAAPDNGAAWRAIEHAADTQVKFNIALSKRRCARPTEPICIARNSSTEAPRRS